MAFDIYGIGAALVDTEIEVQDQQLKELGVEKGLMTLVDAETQQRVVDGLSAQLVHSKRASGGSAANTIIGASYFGAKCFYSCRVGSDDNGAFYLADMQRAGVACNRYDDQQAGTGKCLVLITPDAERTMLTHLGISETLCERAIDEQALKASRYAYLEGYLVTSPTGRAAAIKVRELAEQHGVKTAISLSDPGMVQFFGDGLKEMIGQGVDLLFCNQDEGMGFTQTDSAEAALAGLKAYAKQVVVTRGPLGALAFDGTTTHHIDGFAVKAIDTNGAGDMFAGAFLAAVCAGQDFAEAGRIAARAAAQVVSQYGPRLRPEQHAEILAELKETA